MTLDDKMDQGYAWYLTLHGTRWKTETGQRLDLTEMQDAHRANLRGWLDARAQAIVNLAYWGAARFYSVAFEHCGDMAALDLDRESDREAEEMLDDPIGWLHDTPFYRRLVELLDRDHVDVELPDRPAGAPAPRQLAEV